MNIEYWTIRQICIKKIYEQVIKSVFLTGVGQQTIPRLAIEIQKAIL